MGNYHGQNGCNFAVFGCYLGRFFSLLPRKALPVSFLSTMGFIVALVLMSLLAMYLAGNQSILPPNLWNWIIQSKPETNGSFLTLALDELIPPLF